MTGIGLLCAFVLGAALAWIGPTAYLLVGVYALYTDWHPPTLSTPWIWRLARRTTSAVPCAPPWCSPPGCW